MQNSNEGKVRQFISDWIDEFVDHLFEEKEHATKRSQKLHALKSAQQRHHSQNSQHQHNRDHQHSTDQSDHETSNKEKAQHLMDLAHQINSTISVFGSVERSSLVTSQELRVPDSPIEVPSTLRTISLIKFLNQECSNDKKLPKIMAHYEKYPHVVQLDVLKQR